MAFVIPRNGYKIPDPARKDFLPAAGRDVDLKGEHFQYWARRLADQDVTLQKTQPATAMAKPTQETAALPAPAPAPAAIG